MLRYFDFSAAMLHVFNKVAEHRRVAYLELVVVATGKYALHCTAPPLRRQKLGYIAITLDGLSKLEEFIS